ncbi:DUF2213 domain-containing protein, partial [Enterococcus faecium]|uniref:DUF2213 domain-containing protein n=1 Tax=Enterococcus faecium TaxID=1352 RepID=UPI003DA562A3
MHHMHYADAPAKATRVGSTGTDAAFHDPYLTNSLHIQDKKAIDRINDGSMRELSLAYRYKPIFTAGVSPDGEKYDFLMTDISANHLALVDEGRAGHEVLVYDSKDGAKSMAEEVKTPQATDEEPAKQEAAVAEVAKGVQDLVDLSKPAEPAAPATDEECAKPAEDEEPDAIAALVKDLTAAGLDPSKLPGLEDRLRALAAPTATDEECAKPAADGETAPAQAAEPATDEETAPEAKPAEDEAVTEGLKQCGLDGEDPAVQKAFAEGMKYASQGNTAEAPKADAEAAADRAIRDATAKVEAKYAAIEECRRSLGKAKPMAYDCAGSVYRDAVKAEGINPKGMSDDVARNVYRTIITMKAKFNGAAMDSKPKAQKPGRLSSILGNINKE